MLFSDIEGSTWLAQELRDAFEDVVMEHRRMLREAWAAHNGYEVGTEGDSFFVTFADGSDAVNAAVAGQLALSRHTWPDNVTIRVRMGLHTGEARYGHGGYFGLAVHQAARVAAAAHGGQIIVTDATRATARQVDFVDLGLHRLKDLAASVHLYQVAHGELAGTFPPPRTLSATPNNFPVQTTTFVGREDDVAHVRDALASACVVTLTGAGGVGKSRLALQAAADMIEAFPDGAWLVELAPLNDPGLVGSAVAAFLDVREQPGRDIAATLADALIGKELLVVLDNCEHLIDAAAKLVHDLVSACPRVKVLATSREALNIPAETTMRLRSLSEDEATALFTQRAMSVRPDFEPIANVELMKQICQRVDGLPLAIELAASRVRSMSVADVAARLDDRFRLLTGGSRTALPRQRTLEAAVAWSYDMLPAGEKLFFDRLSVFAGGCSVAAAEAVAGAGNLDEVAAIDMLDHLVNRSLVVAGSTEQGESRYLLLETLRQFGRERLLERGDVEDTRDRHLAWAVSLAATAPQMAGQAAPRGLQLEEDNFRTAIWWAIERGNDEAALRLSGAVWIGHFAERRRLYARLLPPGPDVADDVAARVLFAGGALAFMMADWVDGAERFHHAAEAAACCDDRFILSMSYLYEGACVWGGGDISAAAVLIDQGLTEAYELDNPVAIARGLLARGWIEAETDLDRAEATAREGIEVGSRVADPFERGHCSELLAFTQCMKGDLATGGMTLAETVQAFKDIQHNCASHVLESAAGWCALRERYQCGAELWGAADRIREETLDKPRPWERAIQEEWLPRIVAELPSDVLADAKGRGRLLDVEAALDYAAKVLTNDAAQG